MGTKTENVDINRELLNELNEKLATIEDIEEQAKLAEEYHNKIFIVRK